MDERTVDEQQPIPSLKYSVFGVGKVRTRDLRAWLISKLVVND